MNQLNIFGEEIALPTKSKAYNVPHYSLQLVKDKSVRYEVPTVKSPNDIYRTIVYLFDLSSKPQEHLVMLALDTKNNIAGAFTVHVGTVNTSLVSTRDLFQRALLSNATSIVIAHNHPSGSPKPSTADIEVTKKIQKAAKLLDMSLLDHIIIGDDCYISLLEDGYME